ncbi:hypothetical protein GCM10025298_18060 [Natronobiforma cellulositropha]
MAAHPLSLEEASSLESADIVDLDEENDTAEAALDVDASVLEGASDGDETDEREGADGTSETDERERTGDRSDDGSGSLSVTADRERTATLSANATASGALANTTGTLSATASTDTGGVTLETTTDSLGERFGGDLADAGTLGLLEDATGSEVGALLETVGHAERVGLDSSTDSNETGETDSNDRESSSERARGERPSGHSAADAALAGILGTIAASGAGGLATGSGSAAGGVGAGATGLTSPGASGLLGRLGALLSSKLPGGLLSVLRYSRYDDSDPLEHDGRRAIYETIETDPGTYLSAIGETHDIALSTVRHHVRVLEDEGLITSATVRGKRRYVPVDVPDVELEAALSEPATRRVLETLLAVGPASNSRVADALECDPSTASHHLSGLAEAGLVVRERDGRTVESDLAPAVRARLEGDTPAASVAATPGDD